ncbi:CDP-alcohol phosphatidyltransferase family protein [Ignatzschineria rhizosphaerae]|uniref:CDP-alcohol phosphatidyltransferase family protein n=1 Tax=Ignatzschineria rhizosphaerae TaxID=2923279 RepID=A0ABY3WWM1_9GAMM|nr:CDP-alcohol phosphatidyltransferase family protein [Ignatzschineria rhizosphaerae]UNM95009.1 CDP-alcohol phosphatidyltransferase family protein [Ignatzschineria rhizosphaerae]
MTDKRRPIKSRSNPLMIRLAKSLSQKNITPNQISLFSIVPAFITMLALAFWQVSPQLWVQILLLAVAMIGIQLRLLCNLIDGMVAIEGGKVTPAGELFNEVPDRVSDTFFFIGLGLSLIAPFSSDNSFGLVLGLLASLFAAFTAYIRVLGVSMGAPAFFSGPFAKQHRMALMSASLFATMIGRFFSLTTEFLWIAMIVIIIGSFFTAIRRLLQIYHFKNDENRDNIDL